MEAKRASNNRQSEKGQASVMIGMIVLTFILFFAFVVNTGMLVNAKINLQNAADLAAYAGASVQARQLNTAAYLNYEMRRQYKKFILRYYVVGSYMYSSFPIQPNQATQTGRQWSTGTVGPPIDFQVPVVCLNLYDKTGGQPEGNYCATTKLPAIVIPPPNALDSINSALRDQLQKLEEIRKNSCQTLADTNLQLLTLWLFNTDPNGLDPNTINYGNPPPGWLDRMKIAYGRMRGITYGLGLVPKELILSQRLDTVQKYLNTQARKDLDITQVGTMRNGPDPAQAERTISAFMSAFETLGEHSFPDDSIKMDELLPPGTDGANLANFKTIEKDFDTWALTYEYKNGNAPPPGNNAPPPPTADCVPMAYPVTLRKIPVGVFKDPTILTYYAVRLKAKARVLFSPFGDIELKAYSAAMPFGGRMGPTDQKISDYWTRTGQPPANLQYKFGVGQGQGIFFTPIGEVPNLPILESDDSQTGKGRDTNFAQHHFYETLIPPGGGGQLAMEDLSRGIQAAMAPNPWEAGRYSIINDDNDDFLRYFDKYKTAMLWAPIVPVDKMAQVNDIIRQKVDDLFSTPASPGIDPGKVGLFDLAAFKSSLLDALDNYFLKVKAGQGEGDPYTAANPPPPDVSHEGLNVVMLTDPLSQRPTDVTGGAQFGPINVDPSVMIAPTKVRDAWNTVNDGDFRKSGRVGYSVKFVSFDSLQGKKFTTDGITSFVNLVSGGADGEANDDIAIIKH